MMEVMHDQPSSRWKKKVNFKALSMSMLWTLSLSLSSFSCAGARSEMNDGPEVRQILLIIVRSSAKKTDRTSVRAEDTLRV